MTVPQQIMEVIGYFIDLKKDIKLNFKVVVEVLLWMATSQAGDDDGAHGGGAHGAE